MLQDMDYSSVSADCI